MWREIQKGCSNRPNRQDRPSFEEAEKAMDSGEELTVISGDFREEGEKTIMKAFQWSVLVIAEDVNSPPLVSPMQIAYTNTCVLVLARPHNKK
jgi:hypothetical protein